MKEKFAHILMSAAYNTEIHKAVFETETKDTYIFTVNSFDEAKELVLKLKEDGFGVIELCGAFGEERTRAYKESTDGEVGFGYVVNLPEQDGIIKEFFGH